jgi:hypothetical protein
MKRDLTGGMTRMLKVATTARRSLVNRSTAPRLHFQIFRLRQRPVARPELGLDSLLPEVMVRQVLKEQGADWKRVFYTPG